MGGVHIFWGKNNFYAFDGATLTPIGNAGHEYVSALMEHVYTENIHAELDEAAGEIYLWYPTVGSAGVCNRGIVYSLRTGTWRETTISATAAGRWHNVATVTWA